MPAQQLNRNVGIGGLADGLCMIPNGGGPGLFDINVNEAGLQEATIRFATFDPGQFRPARRTLCTDFISGNAQTTAALALFPYLAAQSSRIGVNAEGDGIHSVEVLVQGAIFDVSLTSAPVIGVPITNKGEYLVTPSVILSGGNEITPANVTTRLELKTRQIVDGGTDYEVGDELTLAGGASDRPVKIRVDAIGTGGSIMAADGGANHVLDHGRYFVVPGNPGILSGGSGSGATVDITWRLAVVLILNGGSYDGIPTASLVSPILPVIRGTLGQVQMGPRGLGGDELIYTTPFDPVTTTKDTVEIPIQSVPEGSTTLRARVHTNTIPGQWSYQTTINNGFIIEFIPMGGHSIPLAPLDGVTMNVGDKVLFDNDGREAGLYEVASVGGLGNWRLVRVDELNSASDVLAKPKIIVAEGSGAGEYEITTEEPFTFNTDAINFEPTGETPEVIVGTKATIEYHAIELNFEYVAREFASRPRFLKDEYQLNSDGLLEIDPIRGRTLSLDVDSVAAVEQVAAVGGGAVSDGAPVTIAEATWRAAIKYVGTAGQFEQTPAGAYYHVKETTTIKIVPIIAPGTLQAPES